MSCLLSRRGRGRGVLCLAFEGCPGGARVGGALGRGCCRRIAFGRGSIVLGRGRGGPGLAPDLSCGLGRGLLLGDGRGDVLDAFFREI